MDVANPIYRSHVIQIPRLASRRRDELERLLAIFDQGLVKGNGRGDAHVLTIAEEEYPAECGAGGGWRTRCGACCRGDGRAQERRIPRHDVDIDSAVTLAWRRARATAHRPRRGPGELVPRFAEACCRPAG